MRKTFALGGEKRSERMRIARIEFGADMYSTKIIIVYPGCNYEIEFGGGKGTFELDLDDLKQLYLNEVNGSKNPITLKGIFNFENSIKITFVGNKAIMIINNNSNNCYMVADPAKLKGIFMDYAEEAIMLSACGEI